MGRNELPTRTKKMTMTFPSPDSLTKKKKGGTKIHK